MDTAKMLALVLAAYVSAINFQATAAVTDGDTADIFSVYSSLIRLGDGERTIEPALAAKPVQPTTLFRLNMTLAEITWQNSFIKSESKNGNVEPKDKPGDLSETWGTRWDTWVNAATFVRAKAQGSKTGGDQITETYGLQKATQQQLDDLREKIATIPETAFEVYATTAAAAKTQVEDSDTLSLVDKPIYDNKKITGSEPNIDTYFEGTAQPYAAARNTGLPPARKTVAATVLCLCCTAQNKATTKPCNAKQATEKKWGAGSSPAGNAWTEIRKICPEIQAKRLTAEAIQTIIQGVLNTIHVSSTNLLIGKYGEDNCDGSNAGTCVKFTAVVTCHTADYSKIKWLAPLTDALSKIQKRKQENRGRQESTAALAKLTQEAKTLAGRAKSTRISASQPQTTRTASSSLSCNQYSTGSTCAPNNRKWEENTSEKSKGECKPKDGEVQTNTPTGDGAAGTTTTVKCSDCDTEEKCGEVNK
uniref:Variant surface glycoprotein n=1 Tax=Trypanosoma brucei TaxID=5691 RepID=A0A1V0FZ80_9TRYP|nr:variant surface glycoprotein [Trypanosoma brucei]